MLKNKKILLFIFLISYFISTSNTTNADDIFSNFNDVNFNPSTNYNADFNTAKNFISGNINQRAGGFGITGRKNWSVRGWKKIGRFDGAIRERGNYISGLRIPSGAFRINAFLIEPLEGIIVNPAIKLVEKAVKSVERTLQKETENFGNKVVGKINEAIYDKLGVGKLEAEINKGIQKVKNLDDKVNKAILVSTDKIGQVKADLDSLAKLGYDITEIMQDENGNIFVRAGKIAINGGKAVGTVNKYVNSNKLNNINNDLVMVGNIVNDWDMILERKIRQAISRSQYELGYALAWEVLEPMTLVRNFSYYTGQIDKNGKILDTNFEASGVPIGASTPEISRPFERFNPDKAFLENTALGFEQVDKKVNATEKKYRQSNKLHQETKEILVDSLKGVLIGQEDATKGNTIGYIKPKIGMDKVKKPVVTNAPFVFNDNEKNVAILKAIPRVQAEKVGREIIEEVKLATALKGANLALNGKAEIGERAIVKAHTTTSSAYTALVISYRKAKIKYYGNATSETTLTGETNPILLSRILQNEYLAVEKKYSEIAKFEADLMQQAYNEQMNAEGTTQLAGFNVDEIREGRTPESKVMTPTEVKTAKDLLNLGNTYLLAEDKYDYIQKGQDKRKELFKERAEIEKIANAVKNEHNAFRDFQNAYANNLLFDETFKEFYKKMKDPKNTNYANFTGNANVGAEARNAIDNLLRRRYMVLEQLNRNLGNQGARFKSLLDAVEYVKKHIDEADLNDEKQRERASINLKRIYQAFAVMTSQTREEISLITKNVINSKRAMEIEEMLLTKMEIDNLLADNERDVKISKTEEGIYAKVDEITKSNNPKEFLYTPKNK